MKLEKTPSLLQIASRKYNLIAVEEKLSGILVGRRRKCLK
jgi:hypothetical protein